MHASVIASIGLAGGLILSATSAAIAQTAIEPTGVAGENAGSEIVCRRQPPPPGTRIGARRICKTQLEWDQIERENRDALERVQNRSGFGNEPPGFGNPGG